MNNMTDYLENKLIDALFRNVGYSIPTTLYIGLFSASPTDTGSQTAEVSTSGTAYARQAISSATSTWSATDSPTSTANPSGGTSATTYTLADIDFPTATADWGTVTSIGILDASSSGNMLWYGDLTVPKTVTTDDTFSIVAGNLSVNIDDQCSSSSSSSGS